MKIEHKNKNSNIIKIKKLENLDCNLLYSVVGGPEHGNIVCRPSFQNRLVCIFPKIQYYSEDDMLHGTFTLLEPGETITITQ